VWLRTVPLSTVFARPIAVSDFFLFPLLKEHLHGTHLSSDSGVSVYLEEFLYVQDELFYKEAAGRME